MHLLRYSATTIGGRRARGRRIAEHPDLLRAALHSEGLRDIVVHSPSWWEIPIGTRVSGRDLALFTQRFGTMTTTTASPATALRKLVALARSATLRRVLTDVTADVQDGSSIAEAMRKHPKVFEKVYTNMVETGERSGHLPEILDKLASRLTKMEEMRGKLITALVYPSGVLLFALAATWYMLAKVIPTFAKILIESGTPLRANTRAILWASDMVRHHQSVVLALMAALVGAGYFALRDHRVQNAAATVLVRVPLIGETVTAAAMANFCGMLALTYGSGLSLVHSVRMSAETIPNAAIRRRVALAAAELAEGGTLAGALERTESIPPEVSDAAAAGEQTGRLAEQMELAAKHYEQDLDQSSRRLSTAAEIALICLVALGIGILVVSIYQPLFQSTRAMAGQHG
jgi:type IV pilus assembly protein PilC